MIKFYKHNAKLIAKDGKIYVSCGYAEELHGFWFESDKNGEKQREFLVRINHFREKTVYAKSLEDLIDGKVNLALESVQINERLICEADLVGSIVYYSMNILTPSGFCIDDYPEISNKVKERIAEGIQRDDCMIKLHSTSKEELERFFSMIGEFDAK